jgi:hypothetical protein
VTVPPLPIIPLWVFCFPTSLGLCGNMGCNCQPHLSWAHLTEAPPTVCLQVEKRLELVKQVSHSTHKKLTACLQGQQGAEADKRSVSALCQALGSLLSARPGSHSALGPGLMWLFSEHLCVYWGLGRPCCLLMQWVSSHSHGSCSVALPETLSVLDLPRTGHQEASPLMDILLSVQLLCRFLVYQ